ncbi:protein detoxification 7 [Quercus suber]|uniref:Protein detoxification 7 n=1 Tax=Quercus suber TaxID=58331 RepID=A0AAW0KBF5_QUESU
MNHNGLEQNVQPTDLVEILSYTSQSLVINYNKEWLKQAYGAEQYQKLGIYTYTDIFSNSSLLKSLVLPMLFSSCATLCFHIPLCWALVSKLKLGCIGATIFTGSSYWLNLIKRLILCQMHIKSIVIVVVFIIISLLLCHHRCQLV